MAYTERYICNYTWTKEHTDKNGKVTWRENCKCDVKAKDAHEDLDIDTIVAKCDEIAEQANELSLIDERIQVYTDGITKKDLCVDGMGVENIAGMCHEQVGENIKAISDDISSVKDRAIEAFNQLQEKYNKLAKVECKQKHDK
ncbi:MAG: hypothetical protein PUC82_00270 [bacterium]|nr:hypothetical protein [bacterium]